MAKRQCNNRIYFPSAAPFARSPPTTPFFPFVASALASAICFFLATVLKVERKEVWNPGGENKGKGVSNRKVPSKLLHHPLLHHPLFLPKNLTWSKYSRWIERKWRKAPKVLELRSSEQFQVRLEIESKWFSWLATKKLWQLLKSYRSLLLHWYKPCKLSRLCFQLLRPSSWKWWFEGFCLWQWSFRRKPFGVFLEKLKRIHEEKRGYGGRERAKGGGEGEREESQKGQMKVSGAPFPFGIWDVWFESSFQNFSKSEDLNHKHSSGAMQGLISMTSFLHLLQVSRSSQS